MPYLSAVVLRYGQEVGWGVPVLSCPDIVRIRIVGRYTRCGILHLGSNERRLDLATAAPISVELRITRCRPRLVDSFVFCDIHSWFGKNRVSISLRFMAIPPRT